MMKKTHSTCLLIILAFLSNTSSSQNTIGNFRTKQSGNWNTDSVWQIRTNIGWIDTSISPLSNETVSIQNGHIVSLDSSISIGDLHIHRNAILACNTFTLSCSGKIRAYTGSVDTSLSDAIYSNSTSPTNGMITCGAGGRFKFIGSSRNITLASEWGASGLTTSAVIEFALNIGETGTLNTGFKANTILITSGIIDMNANRLAPDKGSSGQGDLTISSDATLISAASSASTPVISRTGSSSTGCSGIFLLNGTLRLIGNNPYLEFDSVILSTGSSVEFTGGSQSWLNSSFSGAAPFNSYYNIILSGSNCTKTTLPSQITTINGTLSVQGTANLAIGASATLAYGATSILEYKGSASQSTGSNPPEWPYTSGPNSIIINNSLGVTLGVAREINGILYLTNGILNTTSTNLLTLSATASVTGASNNSFINGPIRKIGNSAFVFPVGHTGTGYQAIGISAPSNISDAFTAEYQRQSPYNLGYLTSGGLTKVSGCEYWQLDRTAGSSTIDILLFGNISSGCSPSSGNSYFTGNGSSLSDLKVSHFNTANSTWENLGGTTSGTSPNIITLATGVSTFSIFTFGTIATNPLPVKLTSFSARIINNNVALFWNTASEYNNDHFEIERSANGIDYITIGVVKGAGTTYNLTKYEFLDTTANLVSLYSFYYRLKQVDIELSSEYSNVIHITLPTQKSNNYTICLNSIENLIEIGIKSPLNNAMIITILNSEGKVTNEYSLTLNLGINKISINTSLFKSGMYFFYIKQEEKMECHKVWIP